MEKFFRLQHKVSFYVPSQARDGAPCANLTDETANLLSDMFGGATCLKAQGYWQGEKGLQVEDVNLVYAFAEEVNQFHIGRLQEHALSILRAANQESVGMEIDANFYLIDDSDKGAAEKAA